MLDDFSGLTDNEGALLALVLREQPITTYQIAKIYEASPVSNFNTSKGKIYPLIRRLQSRGFLASEGAEADQRGPGRLLCTEDGQQELKRWLKQIRSTHLLLEDPLRTKVQSFDLLTKDERIEWIVNAKAALEMKLTEVENYGNEVEVPYQAFVHDNAVSSIRSRLSWLNRILLEVVKGSSPTSAG